MPSPGSSSCSLCSRPIAVDSGSGLCEVCLRTVATADVTPNSAPHQQRGAGAAQEHHAATLTNAPPRLAPADHPFAVQFQSTQSDANRTRTPSPDGDTAFPPPDSRSYLPEPPPGYDLIRPLGSGGMGRVYLAREHGAERTVAIKFLNAPSSTLAYDRFLVEVRSQAKLKHPNIIEVISVEVNWREPFFTMEFAAGGTLADIAKPDQLLPPLEAARLMLGSAAGVAFAHSKNVLHRDLKPSNILLVSELDAAGELIPKVSDFGLAKRTDRDEGLTQTGALGTAPYMSPEAAAGRYREITAATDVYGLGATLYHLLTGRPPFLGDDNVQIVNKVLNDPVARPRSLRPEVPAALEAIVMKSLEKNPAARYPSAEAFAEDLKRFLAGQAPTAPVLSPRRRAQRWLGRNRKRVGVGVGLVMIAASLVAAGWIWNDRPVPVEPPDYVASMRADAAAGKPLTLIGKNGLPDYYRFLLEQNSLGPVGEGECSFHGFNLCMLELAPELGIERYSVSLEVQHLQARLGPPLKGIDTDSVAFYFGHSMTTNHDGTTAHALFAASYKDYQLVQEVDKRPRPPNVYFQFQAIVQERGRAPEVLPITKLNSKEFKAKPIPVGLPRQEPGEWRQIVADITSDEVHVHWRGDDGKLKTLARYSGDEMRAQYADLRKQIDGRVPGAGSALPAWSPRMSFGILSTRSSVAIRKVKVTPLP